MTVVGEGTLAQQKARGGSKAAKKAIAKPGPVAASRQDGAHKRAPAAPAASVSYRRGRGVDDFVRQVAGATPLQLVEIERRGVAGRLLKDLAKRLQIPAVRVFDMLGIPKATAEKKSAMGDVIAGSGGQAAIGMVRLLAVAQEIVANSTADGAKGFDAAIWLGRWLERPLRRRSPWPCWKPQRTSTTAACR
jgi:hypothetical protein